MLRSCRRQSPDRLLLERLGEPSSLPFAHEHPLAHSRAFFGVHETQARSVQRVVREGERRHLVELVRGNEGPAQARRNAAAGTSDQVQTEDVIHPGDPPTVAV